MKSKTFKMFPCDVSKLRKNMIKTKMKQMQKKTLTKIHLKTYNPIVPVTNTKDKYEKLYYLLIVFFGILTKNVIIS